MSYVIKAVGSKKGRRFEGWARFGKSPKPYDVVRAQHEANVFSLSTAQEVKASFVKWAKSLKGITLEFFLIPLIDTDPDPLQLALARPTARRSGRAT